MTRESSSRLLAVFTGVLVFAAAGLFAAMQPSTPPQPPQTLTEVTDTTQIARGRGLFRSVGCIGCHSAEGVGRNRYPLDSVGSRLPADTLRLWIVDPDAVLPGVRKPTYDYLPDEEVDDMVAYLLSLKASES